MSEKEWLFDYFKSYQKAIFQPSVMKDLQVLKEFFS